MIKAASAAISAVLRFTAACGYSICYIDECVQACTGKFTCSELVS